MIIGKFENSENGRITGELDALLADTKPLLFVPNSNGPDYIVLTETACEAGAAWKKTSKDGKKEFVSVRLELALPARPGQRRAVSSQGRPRALRPGLGSQKAGSGITAVQPRGAATCGPALFQHQQRSFSHEHLHSQFPQRCRVCFSRL